MEKVNSNLGWRLQHTQAAAKNVQWTFVIGCLNYVDVFFRGNLKQNKIYHNLVPFYSSTQAAKPDSMTKMQHADNHYI